MDRGAAARIAKAALEGSSQDEPFRVLEIGPGTGTLTAALLEAGADVSAIDIDPQMIGILRGRPELAAATVLQADALSFDYAAFAQGRRWRATGNLPYNIATPLMLHLIEMQSGPEQLVFMIQKDVADRLAAKPSTPAFGSLSLAVQYAMHVQKLFTLGPPVFYPRPKVHSTVVRLTRRDVPAVHTSNPQLFMKIIRGAFAYRRKTLANSLHLALGMTRAQVSEALERSGLNTDIRGEQLDLDQYAALTAALDPH